MGTNGRVRTIDLEGVDKTRNQRFSQIAETMRLLMVRAFAPLDLELPRKGDDKGKGTWRSDTMLATRLPVEAGTMGQVPVSHAITATDGSVIAFSSKGKGVIASGEMRVVNNVEVPAVTLDLSYEGVARFDTATGRLLERDYLVDGRETASSLTADGTAGTIYVQSARLLLLGPDDRPTLPESGPLPPR
jgi:hypothetical protein